MVMKYFILIISTCFFFTFSGRQAARDFFLKDSIIIRQQLICQWLKPCSQCLWNCFAQQFIPEQVFCGTFTCDRPRIGLHQKKIAGCLVRADWMGFGVDGYISRVRGDFLNKSPFNPPFSKGKVDACFIMHVTLHLILPYYDFPCAVKIPP